MRAKSLLKNLAIFATTAALAIFLGQQLPYLAKKWRGPFKEGNYSVHVAKMDNKLTLYGTTTCAYCIAARAYLRKNNIPFNDLIIDQSKSAAEAFKLLNERGVPVLVSTDRLVVGFNQDAYRKLHKIVVGE
jgi:glutaredoxin 3